MRLGFFLPQMGPWAAPESLTRVATEAEALGYDSLWASERTLVPVEPKVPHRSGKFPDVLLRVLDPLESLTFVAAQTSRIALGTSVLVLPWYNPLLLARRLTTLDVLSNGRLRVGLGIGWSAEEYEAAATPWEDRGKRFEEALAAIKTIWTTDPVEFEGDFYSIPRSYIGPKPVQKPHPPIYIGAFTPAARARVARHADAWHPSIMPLDQIPALFEEIKALAADAGRDPATLGLVIRRMIELHDEPLGDDRADFAGSAEQIARDMAAARDLGADELILDVTFDPGVKGLPDILHRLELLFRLHANVLAG